MANLKKRMRKYELSHGLSTMRNCGEKAKKWMQRPMIINLFCFSTITLIDFLNLMFFIFKLLWYILTHATGSTKEQRSLQLQSWAECGSPCSRDECFWADSRACVWIDAPMLRDRDVTLAKKLIQEIISYLKLILTTHLNLLWHQHPYYSYIK